MDDFKAYAFQDGTDYRLVVSLPLNTTINSKNRVSVRINTDTYPNLPVSSTSGSDLFLTGGTVAFLVLTETQFNAIVPAAVLTIDGRSYFTDDNVELYNSRFFPRVSSTTYYAYVVIDGDDYNLYFSAVSSVITATNLSIRFVTDTNTFVAFNGLTFEVIESSTEGLDDYFTQDAQVVKTTLTRTQWLSIASLFETEPEVGINFLEDSSTLQTFLFATVPSNATQLPTEGIDASIGDNLYFLTNTGTTAAPVLGETINFAGVINDVTANDIFYTTEPTSDTPGTNDFFLFGKDPVLETSGVIGFFSKVRFTSNDTARAELFSINSEAFQSSK